MSATKTVINVKRQLRKFDSLKTHVLILRVKSSYENLTYSKDLF